MDPTEDSSEEAFIQQLLRLLSINVDRYFIDLYSAYHALIRDFIANKLGKARDDEAVEDCTQESFANVLRTLKNKRPDEILALSTNLKGWLYETAKNTVFRYLKSQATTVMIKSQGRVEREITIKTLSSEEDSPELQLKQKVFEEPEAALVRKENLEELRSHIEALPEPYCMAVRLYYLEGLTHHDVARRLNLSENTVKSHVYRGVRKLRRRMEEGY